MDVLEMALITGNSGAEPGSFPVKMFCVSQHNSENCSMKDSALGSGACAVLNTVLFLSLILRIKG